MSNSYKQQSRKFDDEKYSGRSGKHAKHSNNRLYGTIPTIIIVDEIEDADFYDINLEAEDEI